MKKSGLLIGSILFCCAGLWLAFRGMADPDPESPPRPSDEVAATQGAPSVAASSPADVDMSTAGLDVVRNAARQQAADEGDQALFRAAYKDPKEFIKIQWSAGMGFGYTRKLLGPEAAPVLAGMLRDAQYRVQWFRISEALGYVGDDQATADALMEYAGRPEDWSAWDKKSDLYFAAMGKIRALEWIGRIGGEKAEAFLKEALTADGAKALVKSWAQSSPFPEAVRGGAASAEELIRGRAAKGLIFTGKPENIALAMSVYEKEHKQVMATGESGQFYSGLVSAAATADYIADHGNKVEAFLELNGDCRQPEKFSPYIKKRSWRSGKVVSSQ
jgi:hypothetical protein